MFGFDKTFFRFLWGFLGILIIGLGFILFASAYKKDGRQVPLAAEGERAAY